MNVKQPLLSICIPTYNRAEVLRDTLEHYTSCEEFDDEVELIISDNASTDATKSLCTEYAEQYKNIRYFRNKENIMDANFYTVLNYAKGEYLKLANDCVSFNNAALRYMKQMLHTYRDSGDALIFTSGYIYIPDLEIIVCESLDQYFQALSIGLTNNNMFGCWKLDWEKVTDWSRYTHLKLQQVDWSCQIALNAKKIILCNKDILTYHSKPSMTRVKYNWFKVHLDNYYTILRPYNNNGEISNRTMKNDRRNLLNFYKSYLYQIFLFHRDRGFETNGTWSYFYKWYKHDLFFYWFIVTMPFQYIYDRIKRQSKKRKQ